VEPLAELVWVVPALGAAPAGKDRAGGGHAGESGESGDLPRYAHRLRRLGLNDTALSLHDAVALASTGDIWLFRGRSMADVAIRAATNSPVNHVGMVVALEDLPALLWHAELGRSLPDVWSGERERGVQLHLLAEAVQTWKERYRQKT